MPSPQVATPAGRTASRNIDSDHDADGIADHRIVISETFDASGNLIRRIESEDFEADGIIDASITVPDGISLPATDSEGYSMDLVAPVPTLTLNPLVAGTVENLRTQGIPNALPGPLTRADVGTIASHLRALEAVDEEIAVVYRQLARLSFPMLVERGVVLDEVERLLAEK